MVQIKLSVVFILAIAAIAPAFALPLEGSHAQFDRSSISSRTESLDSTGAAMWLAQTQDSRYHRTEELKHLAHEK